MIADVKNATPTITTTPIYRTRIGQRVEPTLFVDQRPTRPLGMETASCLKCRTPYTHWNHYQTDTDLQCINCGHYLATWIPK